MNDYIRIYTLLFGYNNKNTTNTTNKAYNANNDKNNDKDEQFVDREIELPGITKITINNDINIIKKLINVNQLKKEGDLSVADGDLDLALEKYNLALDIMPIHVGCLSNRSACKLSLNDVQGCIDDCSLALSLLNINNSTNNYTTPTNSNNATTNSNNNTTNNNTQNASNNSNEINMLSSILPPLGSEKRKSWIIKTVLRRGAAYVQLNLLDLAVEDYRTAIVLDNKNEVLKSDLNKLMNYREGKRGDGGEKIEKV